MNINLPPVGTTMFCGITGNHYEILEYYHRDGQERYKLKWLTGSSAGGKENYKIEELEKDTPCTELIKALI
jgi:hypothetical protein